jgi:hypothetical protein
LVKGLKNPCFAAEFCHTILSGKLEIAEFVYQKNCRNGLKADNSIGYGNYDRIGKASGAKFKNLPVFNSLSNSSGKPGKCDI